MRPGGPPSSSTLIWCRSRAGERSPRTNFTPRIQSQCIQSFLCRLPHVTDGTPVSCIYLAYQVEGVEPLRGHSARSSSQFVRVQIEPEESRPLEEGIDRSRVQEMLRLCYVLAHDRARASSRSIAGSPCPDYCRVGDDEYTFPTMVAT